MKEHIIADLQQSYGLQCLQAVPVSGGWLNEKWRVSTGRGEVLVKEFSRERYHEKKLRELEEALRRQAVVAEYGVACPHIFLCGGRAVRLLDDGTAYMVMEFCPGRTESSATVTLPQIRSLGSACGQMHQAFSRLPSHAVQGYPLNGEKLLRSLWENYSARRKEFPGVSGEYRSAVLDQEAILTQLTPGFFDRLPQGICHEDFSSDNILFDGDKVSVIVDFDRNRYSCRWHDVGRALLCFAWENGALDRAKTDAFLEGYAQYFPITRADVADVLRLSWCIEAPWWIQPDYFANDRGKTVRFREEILWVTRHWFEL